MAHGPPQAPGMVLALAWLALAKSQAAVPAEVKASAEALRDSLADGSYHTFTGPLNKQDGSVWLKAGETAADYGPEGLAEMLFYLEGLDGEVPN